MRKILSPLVLGLLVLGLIAPAAAQRRGGSSRGRSSSSRSRSSGSVHVKGYFRKDGTYVHPHYRTRANGISSDNWSFRGNFNPYTGEVGTKSYPLGVWRDPKDGTRLYNTPFLGVTADYDADGLLIKDATRESRLQKGWRVSGYRFSKEKSFTSATSWRALSSAAMDSDEGKIVLKGSRADGKEFTQELRIQGAETFFGPDDNGYLAGVQQGADGDEAVVESADAASFMRSGMVIMNIRTPMRSNDTPVSTWADVRRFLEANPTDEVVVSGIDGDGSRFEVAVATNRAALASMESRSAGIGAYFVNVVHSTGAVPAVVSKADASTGLENGMTIIGLRDKDEPDFAPVSTWEDVKNLLLKSHNDEVSLRVKDEKGAVSEHVIMVNRRELDGLMPTGSRTTTADDAGYYLAGIVRGASESPATVTGVEAGCPLEAGMTIESIRLVEKIEGTKVTGWGDVVAFLHANHPGQAVVSGKDKNGKPFVLTVKVRRAGSRN